MFQASILVFVIGFASVCSKYIIDDSTEKLETFEDYHHDIPKYVYSYSVEDEKTGDFKEHKEERDGDITKGEYTMAYPDGSFYTVSYIVTKDDGYKAVVSKSSEEGVKTYKYGFGQNAHNRDEVQEYKKSDVDHVKAISSVDYQSEYKEKENIV